MMSVHPPSPVSTPVHQRASIRVDSSIVEHGQHGRRRDDSGGIVVGLQNGLAMRGRMHGQEVSVKDVH